jgi:hypothetical protein
MSTDGPLWALRPLERLQAVLADLAASRRRLLEQARPGPVTVYVAATSDGACVVAPLSHGDLARPRLQRLAAALAGALATATGLDSPVDGRDAELEAASWRGYLALRGGSPDGSESAVLFELALEEHARVVDRIDPDAVLLPPSTLDDTEPAAAPWLWRAELAARLGGLPGDAQLPPEIEEGLQALAVTRPADDSPELAIDAHGDPNPRRRAVRRILRRLDGMGKYGGYHTEFSHLARGFPGHERNLALEAGEALLRAGLLDEKPSVGQRHVALVASRTAEIRTLVESGETRDPSLLEFFDQ